MVQLGGACLRGGLEDEAARGEDGDDEQRQLQERHAHHSERLHARRACRAPHTAQKGVRASAGSHLSLLQLGVQQRKAWPERNEAPGLAQLVPQRRQQRDA